MAVWHALLEIPPGSTATYGEIARQLGRPGAARAVGAANGRNPVSIIVPCHRLVGADGSLTGYGWGIDRKRQLLELERRPTRRGQLGESVISTVSSRLGTSGTPAAVLPLAGVLPFGVVFPFGCDAPFAAAAG